MSPPYSPESPDTRVVRLQVVDAGVELTRWTSYSFASHFLTPASGWSLTIGDGDLPQPQRKAIRIGAKVKLFVDEFPLATGFIDAVDIDAAHGRGVTYSIHGRDVMGPVVDSVADPRLQFKDGTTLAEFLIDIFDPFGFDEIAMDGSANRDAKTGGLRGIPMSKGRKPSGGKKTRRKSKKASGPKPLEDFTLHQLKPHNHEGLYRFARRVVERHGLWIWASADGEQLIISKPDFTQEPRYQLRRRNDGSPGRTNGTNILGGTVRFDGTDQPSVIIADGFSGGGEFGRGKIKSYCINPYFGIGDDGTIADDVSAVLAKYPEASPVTFTTQPFTRRAPRMPPRPMFLHDEESKTQEQLDWFVRRTMSELLRKSMVCHYTVEGHGQMNGGAFTPWDIDTVVDVQDDVAGVNERMYVLARTFEKSRSSGTTTKLELVRLNSIAADEGS